MDTLRAIAIIYARGRGSSLPNKTLYPLCGKPLIWHFLQEMRKAKFLDEIAVWSESEEVAEVVRECGCTPFVRPREMVHYASGFASPAEWRECINSQLTEHFGNAGNIQVHLNCNYLMLRAATLERMYDTLLEDPQANLIVPIYPVDPHLYIINEATRYLFPVWEYPGLDRQKYPQLYRKVGVSIRHVLRGAFGRPENELYHQIPRHEGVDVQNAEDIPFAEYLLAKRMSEEVQAVTR